MVFTLVGIVTLDTRLQPANASLPIAVTVRPLIVEGIATAPLFAPVYMVITPLKKAKSLSADALSGAAASIVLASSSSQLLSTGSLCDSSHPANCAVNNSLDNLPFRRVRLYPPMEMRLAQHTERILICHVLQLFAETALIPGLPTRTM